MKKKACLFIISAPSGTGKSTVVGELLKKNPDLRYSVSYTTRKPRKGEEDGVNYHFVDKKTFKKLIEEDFFAEWANVYGHLYGTPKREILEFLQSGKSIIFDIDVQGGMNLKKCFPNAITIFLTPPSFEVLKKRLSERKTDAPQEISKRLEIARKEMNFKDKYDYCVINDSLSEACSEILRIITRHENL